MPDHNSFISPGRHVPQWLATFEEKCAVALPLVTSTYLKLREASQKDEKQFYSNLVLAETVNRMAECKGLLVTLRTLEKDFTERSKYNRQFYEERRSLDLQVISKLSDEKNRLLLAFIQWQQQALEKFSIAQKRFDELQKKITGVLIKPSKQTVDEFYQEFKNDFGDVVTYTYDENDNVVGIVGRQYLYVDFPKEPTSDLPHFAGLIKCDGLVKQAKQYADAESAFQKTSAEFYANKPDWLDEVDEKSCKDITSLASQLAGEYEAAADKLSKESHEFYDELDKKELALREQMIAAKDAIKAMRKRLEDLFDKIRKPTILHCRILIATYEEFEISVATALSQYEKLEADFLKIKAQYKKAGERFGVYRESVVDDLEYSVKEKLRAGINKADSAKADYFGEYQDYKVTLALEELLCLLKNSIINNVEFWHEQISFFGSDAKIGKVTVPKGIAQIHNQDFGVRGTKEALAAILKTIDSRIGHGTGGWFSRRTLNTTDTYYHATHALNLNTLTHADVVTLKERFERIGLKELDIPRYSVSPEERHDLCQCQADQELSMSLSDFLASDRGT